VRSVRDALAARTAEVRDLARTLVPNALDAGDLDAALAELANRFSSDRLQVRAESRGASQLDATRQVGVHHLAAEAVLLLRRSAARDAVVRVDASDPESVQLEVRADAPFASGARAASILDSLADRAEELGGDLQVDAAGDRVRVVVPT
jgi:signal transduction histidine kinase